MISKSWWQLLIFILIAVIYYIWTVSDQLAWLGGDNAVYLLTAQSWSLWSESSSVADYFAKHSLYPPLFPALLAIFDAGNYIDMAHIITTTCLLLALISFYFLAKSWGFPAITDAIITLLIALLPSTYIEALSIHSENLYLLLSLFVLLMVEYYSQYKQHIYLIIAVIGLTALLLTRTIGIALWSALILFAIYFRPKQLWVLLGIAILPLILWNMIYSPESSGYLTDLVTKYSNDPIAILLNEIQVKAQLFWSVWLQSLYGDSLVAIPMINLMLAILLGLVGLGLLLRLYLLKLDAYYIVIYIGIVLIWPYPAEMSRFLFVILPILLLQALFFIDYISRMVNRRLFIASHAIFFLMLVVSSLPKLILIVDRYYQPINFPQPHQHIKGWYLSHDIAGAVSNVINYQVIGHSIQQAVAFVDENACVFAIKPSIFAFYGKRLSYVPPRNTMSEQQFWTEVEQQQCQYFYLMALYSPSFPSYYPLKRIESSTVELDSWTVKDGNHQVIILARLYQLRAKD